MILLVYSIAALLVINQHCLKYNISELVVTNHKHNNSLELNSKMKSFVQFNSKNILNTFGDRSADIFKKNMIFRFKWIFRVTVNI